MSRSPLTFQNHLPAAVLLCIWLVFPFCLHAQNVGIGTLSPTSRLHVVAPGSTGYVGGIYLEAPNMQEGSTTAFALGKNGGFFGNQGEIRYSWAGNFSLNNRIEFGFNSIQPFVAFTSGERVGIGTVDPSARLHVVGQMRIQDGTEAAGKVLTSDANGFASWVTPTAGMETDPEVAMAISNCVPKWNGTALTDGLIVDNGTNVGIGVANPSYKLTLGGNEAVFAVDNTATFTAKNSQGVYENYFWPRWNDDRMILNYGAGGFQIRDNNSHPRMHILANGNIGIGTTSPTALLHVLGSIRLQDGTQAPGRVLTSDANGVASWQAPAVAAETDPQVASTVNNQIPKWNGTALTDGLITDNGTNIGIGTATPGGKLHVQTAGTTGYAGHIILQAPSMNAGASTVFMSGKNNGTRNQGEIRWTYNGDDSFDNRFEFGFANIQPFVSFTAGERVGIGTLTPSAKLDVIGQVKITDGTQAAGKVLTSDAYGVASWQTPVAGVETDPQVASTVNNQIPKWNGTALADGLITDNGTNIGVGTTTPAGKLHVQTTGTTGYAGHVILQAPSMNAGASTVFMTGKNNGTRNQGEIRWTYNGDNSSDNRFEFGFANIQPFVSFTAGDRVGIGTLTPNAKLDVIGQVKITDGTQAAGKVLTSDENGFASWQTVADLETDPQVASAVNNQIPKWNGTALADGLITDNGTNIGIGTTSPTAKLHVQSAGTSGFAGSILMHTPSMNAGSQAVLMMGKNNSTNNQAELRFNYAGSGSGDNRYEFGFSNNQPNVIINAFGRLGIGTLAPGGLLELGLDQGRKPSTSTWTITSDARVKNIEGQYTKGLDEIIQLNPIVYHYKNTRDKTFSAEVLAAQNVGLTAQDAQEVFPEAVGVDPDGTLNLNMHSIFIAGINAIKELNDKVEAQQDIINNQQQQINELMAKFDLILNQSLSQKE